MLKISLYRHTLLACWCYKRNLDGLGYRHTAPTASTALIDYTEVPALRNIIYRTRAVITRGLYTFYPLFEVKKGAFFLKFWPYVWLVFKSGL